MLDSPGGGGCSLRLFAGHFPPSNFQPNVPGAFHREFPGGVSFERGTWVASKVLDLFFKGDFFTDSTMVNHHQTTIWEI